MPVARGCRVKPRLDPAARRKTRISCTCGLSRLLRCRRTLRTRGGALAIAALPTNAARSRPSTGSDGRVLWAPAFALRHAHYSHPLLLGPSPLEGEGARGQRPRAGGGCKRRASTIDFRGARIPWCGACGHPPPVSARDERFALARALPTSPSRGEGQKCVHALALSRGQRDV